MDDTETITHFELTQYAKQTQLSQIFDERHTNWNLARQEHSESYVQNINYGQTFYSEKNRCPDMSRWDMDDGPLSRAQQTFPGDIMERGCGYQSPLPHPKHVDVMVK